MNQFSPFISQKIAHDQRIKTAKTLLIYNTDSALSLQIADYYQTVRSIGHKLGLAIGLLSTVVANDVYADVVLPVASYIEQHNIEAVIVSVDCPMFFDAVDSGFQYGTKNSFDALLGGALYCQAIGGLPLAGEWRLNANEAITAKGFTGLSRTSTAPASEPVAPNGESYDVIISASLDKMRDGSSLFRPFGRIGVPTYSGTAAETYTETVRMIDDAIWAEQQNTVKHIAIGVHNRVNRIAPPWQWMAYEFAQAAGHTTDFYVNSYGVTDQSWFDKAPAWHYSNILAGTESVVADAYIGGALVNLDINHSFKNSLSPKRGAWGWDGTSYNFEQVAALIEKGGCAGIATIQEPFENSLIDAASLMSLALKGWSLIEINYLGQNQFWRMSVYGDPLYRPFPAIGLIDGELSTITDQTPEKSVVINTAAQNISLTNSNYQISENTPSRIATWHA